MEDGEIDLDNMMAKYQTGMNLIKLCRKNIDEAEFKLSKYQKWINQLFPNKLLLE